MKVLLGVILAVLIVSGFEEDKQFIVSDEVKNILKNVRVGGAARPFTNISWSNSNTQLDPNKKGSDSKQYRYTTQKSQPDPSTPPHSPDLNSNPKI